MTNKVFLDTSFALALSTEHDALHGAALVLSELVDSERPRLITTHAILLEIGNALARVRHRAAAIEVIDSLQQDQDVEIVRISDDLFAQGFGLFSQRADKSWSLTDCISFVVMRDRGIVEALTSDSHFRQAGFRPLLSTNGE
jgi:uncharacterized protein